MEMAPDSGVFQAAEMASMVLAISGADCE